MLALAVTAAIVVGDGVALRASPDGDAARQSVLYRGDWVEVRGERKGWFKVYDHRHERPGWIAEGRVRTYAVEPASAAQLHAVVEFLRDTPGSESLGIAYAALYLKVADGKEIDGAVFDALGTMATRLAQRGSAHDTGRTDTTVAAQLEVAESWGIHFRSIELGDGDTRICYDGDAFRYVLALDKNLDHQARATLALTDRACVSPTLALTEKQTDDEARLALVDKLDPTRVTGWIGNELRLRRAELASSLVWVRAKRGDATGAKQAAEAALQAFLRVDKAELADDDWSDFQQAALHVAASQWATGAVAPASKVTLATTSGENGEGRGETCIGIGKTSSLRCTHGQIWNASFRVAPNATSAAVAVQPMPGWLELWVFRKGNDGGWMVDVLTPTTEGVDLGYVELAGWSPDSKSLLVVREAREAGVVHRAFQIVNLGTLAIEAQTQRFAGSGKFKQWASSDWRGRTLALR
ncbi:MAG: hypothetical protein JWO36_6944 [Myxococcales bacterium]|nr:hypothetical protein [Myxococcales bacterium]